MPIKPENKGRYPLNWREIRARILVRADNRCERCLVRNYETIVRGTGPHAGTYMLADASVFCDQTGRALGVWRMSDYHNGGESVRVILTIAHLDHTPENCGDDNLRAWCQKCHLEYDRPYHQKVRAQTTRAKKAVEDFFKETE